MACVHHLVYSSLGIALDDMDVPLRVLFSGTTTMTLLNSALEAERTLHTQLKCQNTELQANNEGLERSILFNHSMILRYIHGTKQKLPNSNKTMNCRLQSKIQLLQVAHAQ